MWKFTRSKFCLQRSYKAIYVLCCYSNCNLPLLCSLSSHSLVQERYIHDYIFVNVYKMNYLFRIWGSHSGNPEHFYLLGITPNLVKAFPCYGGAYHFSFLGWSAIYASCLEDLKIDFIKSHPFLSDCIGLHIFFEILFSKTYKYVVS
jgi:hypothetical protein